MIQPSESAKSNGTPKLTPTRWYHWLLVYPALLVSLVGMIPTVIQAIKAWKLNVPYGEVQSLEEQKKLWEKNLGCLTSKGIYSVDGPLGMIVGVTLCPNGDALLRYYLNEEYTYYIWVKAPKPYRRGEREQ